MKRKIFNFGVFLLVPFLSISKPLVCYYPDRCVEIIGTSFSAGHGGTPLQYIQVFCRNKKGEYELLIDKIFNNAGIFGFGRAYMPTWFVFKKWDEKYLECKKE